ncbi:MAG: TrkA C-terminal domain-containing protein [Chlamydiota bacterium]
MDYQHLLGLSKGYNIVKIKVDDKNWMVDSQIKELEIHTEGILVLSVQRDSRHNNEFIGAPSGDIVIRGGDLLVCYGAAEACQELSDRPKGPVGDLEHEESVQKSQQKAEKDQYPNNR